MKQTKTRNLLACLLALLLITTSTGCQKQPSDAENPNPSDGAITVTDMTGREITLDKPAERIVVLTAAECEILYAIGAGNTLIGRGEYCDYPAEVLNVPAVQSGSKTNLEQIIALKPQVLIMNTMDQPDEQIDALEKAGIKVVVSDSDDIEGTYQSIELIGALMGKQEEANQVITSMKSIFDTIASESANAEPKSVYFEVSPLEYGLWAAGSNTFMHEIATMMGLKNIFEEIDGWGEVSEEQIISRNPDYIVTVSMFFGEGPTPEEEILARTGWETITAVKNKAVLNLRNNELSRPAPRLAEGAQLLFEFVYGEKN